MRAYAARKVLQSSLTIVARNLCGIISIIFHGMFSSFHKKPSKKYNVVELWGLVN